VSAGFIEAPLIGPAKRASSATVAPIARAAAEAQRLSHGRPPTGAWDSRSPQDLGRDRDGDPDGARTPCGL